MIDTICTRLLSVAMIAVLGVQAFAQPTPDSGATGRDGQEDNANIGIEMLHKSLDLSTGVLSTDERSASDRFTTRIRTKDADGTQAVVEIARDKNHVAIVVRDAASGLPLYFMCEGLLITFDPAEPGRIIYMTHGAPEFVFTVGDAGPDLQMRYARDLREAHINIDARSILEGAIKRAAKVTYDADAAKVTLQTVHSTVRASLSTATVCVSSIHIEEFSIQSDNGEIGVQSLPISAGEAALKADFHTFQALGIPMRAMNEGAVLTDRLLVPPKGFPRSDAEKQAAKTLLAMLPSTTQP
jgi:hypothetical protein